MTGTSDHSGESAHHRRRARTVALQALYELDATTHPDETVLQRRLEDDGTPAAAATYAGSLVRGVRGHQPAIDEQIERIAPAWPLDQMSRVDKSILRLAIYEMLFEPDLPSRVAINEAVELAKEYGHETSPRFVNGVLGSLERERRAGKLSTLKQPNGSERATGAPAATDVREQSEDVRE